jgi:hypothetical protein
MLALKSAISNYSSLAARKQSPKNYPTFFIPETKLTQTKKSQTIPESLSQGWHPRFLSDTFDRKIKTDTFNYFKWIKNPSPQTKFASPRNSSKKPASNNVAPNSTVFTLIQSTQNLLASAKYFLPHHKIPSNMEQKALLQEGFNAQHSIKVINPTTKKEEKLALLQAADWLRDKKIFFLRIPMAQQANY